MKRLCRISSTVLAVVAAVALAFGVLTCSGIASADTPPSYCVNCASAACAKCAVAANVGNVCANARSACDKPAGKTCPNCDCTQDGALKPVYCAG